MILGLGVDLVSINRIAEVYRKRPARFLKRIFTAHEQELILKKAYPVPAMASRFAAKEAVLKAIGCGMGPAGLVEVEVLSRPGQPPQVKLYGRAANFAGQRGITAFELSMTHDQPFACAVAVALAAGQAGKQTQF